MCSKKLLLVAVCVGLAACNTSQTHIGDESPVLGETVKYDAALQINNPTPAYAANAAQPGSNGDTGALAVKRYRTDTVKPVETMQTTAGTSSNSGYTPH